MGYLNRENNYGDDTPVPTRPVHGPRVVTQPAPGANRGSLTPDPFLASRRLKAISTWIDNHNGGSFDLSTDAGQARAWGRVAKVAEEIGEVNEAGGSDVVVSALAAANGRVVAALIGATDQNLRKGETHTEHDVMKELADVALTALAAIESIQGNEGMSIDRLFSRIREVALRAGLEGS